MPCVTLRENTERPETADVGANHVAGISPEKIVKGVDVMLNVKRDWSNPFGVEPTKKIIDIIERELLV